MSVWQRFSFMWLNQNATIQAQNETLQIFVFGYGMFLSQKMSLYRPNSWIRFFRKPFQKVTRFFPVNLEYFCLFLSFRKFPPFLSKVGLQILQAWIGSGFSKILIISPLECTPNVVKSVFLQIFRMRWIQKFWVMIANLVQKWKHFASPKLLVIWS